MRESTHSAKLDDAKRLLRVRLGEAEKGTVPSINFHKVTVAEIVADLTTDYRANGRRTVGDLDARWRLHLRPVFGAMRATAVTTQHVDKYKADRLREGAARATVNRELSALRAAFNYAVESDPPKVASVPRIRTLDERDNVRTGFVEPGDHDRLAAECALRGLWLRTAFEIGYVFGWRLGELLTLRCRHVDLAGNTLRLDAGTTKNREGRVVYMTKAVRELVAASLYGKKPEDHLLTRKNGQAVRAFRGAWRSMCIRAGLGRMVCPECGEEVSGKNRLCAHCGRSWKRSELRYSGLLFHDLRRTAVRNLCRAGVVEKVAMQVTGHRTRNTFERYNITNERDVRNAAACLDAAREREHETALAVAATLDEAATFGQSLGIVEAKIGVRNATGAHPANLPN